MDSASSFSIIVPTLYEACNIRALIHRIAAIDYGKRAFEVIIVDDDSKDGTEEIVAELRRRYSWLSLVIRRGKPKQLSLAILEGVAHAKHPIIVIMDGDMSHPPEKIPAMLDCMADTSVEMVIGSRYTEGGTSDTAWPWLRQITSKLSACIAKLVLFTQVKDPLSGFLLIRKTLLTRAPQLNPIGWKLGLEIMVKCKCQNIKEVPIHFSQRLRGKSKLNMKTIASYLTHIIALIRFRFRERDTPLINKM